MASFTNSDLLMSGSNRPCLERFILDWVLLGDFDKAWHQAEQLQEAFKLGFVFPTVADVPAHRIERFRNKVGLGALKAEIVGRLVNWHDANDLRDIVLLIRAMSDGDCSV